MTITKMYQIIMMFLLTYKRSLAQSANSQQPTANSQQVIFTVIILYFVIYIFCVQEQSRNSECFLTSFCGCSFFYAYFGSSTGLCSMFTKVNIPFVCVANSPLLTDRKVKGDPETSSG
jgi:hypothetical protein